MKRNDSIIEVCATVTSNDRLYDLEKKQKDIAKRSRIKSLIAKIEKSIKELKEN